jgi:16S rRNA (cytosine1402-N4)-methyltransferase
MRMEIKGGLSAADIVNEWPEAELARVFAMLGEERRARAVARAIVGARGRTPIRRTGELADIIRGVVRGRPGEIDPATRSFQALRMLVNDELSELAGALFAAERALKPGGRLLVISFHSLEDRIVKTFFAARSGAVSPSRHRPERMAPAASFRLLTRKPVSASKEEVADNPRARSAKLRVAERNDAPARADDPLAQMLARFPSLDSPRAQ